VKPWGLGPRRAVGETDTPWGKLPREQKWEKPSRAGAVLPVDDHEWEYQDCALGEHEPPNAVRLPRLIEEPTLQDLTTEWRLLEAPIYGQAHLQQCPIHRKRDPSVQAPCCLAGL